MVPGPKASTSSENLLETQIFRSHIYLLGNCGGGQAVCVLTSLPVNSDAHWSLKTNSLTQFKTSAFSLEGVTGTRFILSETTEKLDKIYETMVLRCGTSGSSGQSPLRNGQQMKWSLPLLQLTIWREFPGWSRRNKIQRAAEGSPQVLCWLLIRAWVWGNYLRERSAQMEQRK